MAQKFTDQIVRIEFDLFDKVNNVGGRASCQDDFDTFSIMRSAQFDAWDDAARESYLQDLQATSLEGRNLVMEKYAYMSGYEYMGETEDLDEKKALLVQIMEAMEADTRAMRNEFPLLALQGRPLSDEPGSAVSLDRYLLCELMTYSTATLRALHARIEALKDEGTTLPKLIMENTVRAYGFADLAEAEAKLAAAFGAPGAQ